MTLLNEDYSAAPAMLLPAWSGWIATTADATVTLGSIACFVANFTCVGVTVPVNLCVVACDCGPVSEELESWGTIKSIFR